MRAKSNSPSPAQRQAQVGAQKANSYQCRIAEADNLHISPFREDGVTYGTPTWIWSVAVDGALYFRGYNGPPDLHLCYPLQKWLPNSFEDFEIKKSPFGMKRIIIVDRNSILNRLDKSTDASTHS